MKLIKWVLGYCGHCRQYFVYPKRRRMGTQYYEEESNYCKVCLDCFQDIEEYWREMWAEYYSGCL